MAITIEDMAASYVQTVQAELQRAVETMQQREYITQVEAHLVECRNLIESGQAHSIVGSDPPAALEENPVTTVESALPENPFVSI